MDYSQCKWPIQSYQQYLTRVSWYTAYYDREWCTKLMFVFSVSTFWKHVKYFFFFLSFAVQTWSQYQVQTHEAIFSWFDITLWIKCLKTLPYVQSSHYVFLSYLMLKNNFVPVMTCKEHFNLFLMAINNHKMRDHNTNHS